MDNLRGVANLTNYVGEGNATLTVSGGTLNGSLTIGNIGSFSQLTITNGGVVAGSAGYVGNFSANNAALVTGMGGLWTNSNSLTVGNYGSFNQLTIANSGRVVSSDGFIGTNAGANNNLVTVTGAGSAWSNSTSLTVGYAASGNQLTVQNGGQVLNSLGYIGAEVGASSNVVLVTGADSLWRTAGAFGDLSVGDRGSFNRLIVSNQGQVVNGRYGFVGYYDTASNNSALISGTGSLWSVAQMLVVGRYGSGNSLTITNSGTVSAPNITIGASSTSTGNLIIVSGGSLFATNIAGTGALDIRRGALALNSGTVTVNQLLATNFASSVVSFNGGTLNSGGSTVNNGSIFHVGDGSGAATLHLNGGTHSFANSLFINTNATLSGTGAITGVITNSGSIAPGDSPGILSGSSSLTLLGNSLLTMQLAGTNDWLYDQLNLAGALNFGGTLSVSLLDGFTVGAGNRFDLFDFSGSSGMFSLTNLPGLDPLMYWDTSALYSTGEIEADWMTGALQVTLSPAAVVSGGAQWQVDGGAWQNSGDTVTNLVIGDHTLAFKDVAGWIKPTNRVVQVAFGETTVTNGGYELTPTLLAAASRKAHGAAGAFDLTLNLNSGVNPTVEPRKNGPTQVFFTFNKAMTAVDGVLSANEFTLTNATFVSANLASSNLTLNLTNVVDQAKVTVVLKGLGDLAGNALAGTNAVRIRSLYGDANQSGTVSIGDMGAAKAKFSSTVTVTNYLCDVNLTGSVTIGDMQVAKTNLTHTVALGGLDLGGTLTPASLFAPSFAAPAVVFPATLGEGLGAPELAWSTNGDEVWEPTLAPDGSVAAWSGSIGDLNVSWVETTVTGPGTIAFQWKVSSEVSADWLVFSVDGVDQPGRISGETEWQTQTFSIGAGTHRLTWTYGKNRANAVGYDAGWLRGVVWQRSP